MQRDVVHLFLHFAEDGLDHLLALADGPGHQLLAQDVQPGLHALGRRLGVQVQGQGDFLPVDGAFYIYCDIGRYSNDSMSFCRDVLNGAGVAITPGLDFDEARGARTVRLSFAGSLAECQEAVTRLGAWLRRRT